MYVLPTATALYNARHVPAFSLNPQPGTYFKTTNNKPYKRGVGVTIPQMVCLVNDTEDKTFLDTGGLVRPSARSAGATTNFVRKTRQPTRYSATERLTHFSYFPNRPSFFPFVGTRTFICALPLGSFSFDNMSSIGVTPKSSSSRFRGLRGSANENPVSAIKARPYSEFRIASQMSLGTCGQSRGTRTFTFCLLSLF